MASTGLVTVVKEGQSVHQAYPYHWLPLRGKYNIAILTGDGEAASYLYSPFNERPFSKPLPPIGQHRAGNLCVLPFADDEVVEPDFAKGPRWVTATDDFSNQAGSLKAWRDRAKALEITNPSTDLTRVYVGCSYCGFGGWIGLPSRYSELRAEYGIPFVCHRWS